MISRLAAAFAALASVPAPAFAASSETALRCSIPSDIAIYARNTGAIGAVAKSAPMRVRTGQSAPDLMVEDWKPAPGLLSSVLGELGREAGFAITGADGIMGVVSWTKAKAPLSEVLDALTAQAGASWSFSSGVVHISKTPPVSRISGSIQVGANRDVTLALLDTLRGYEASEVTLGSGRISFVAPSSSMPRIESGLTSIGEIYAFDVSFYEGRPAAGRYAWSDLKAAGSVIDGAGGRFNLPDGAPSVEEFLASSGDLRPGGSQTVAGPAGWSLVVPQSQCGQGGVELTIKPKRTSDGFGLAVSGGGFTADVPQVTLGQTLVLASREPVGGWIRVVSIRPRIVAVR